MDNLWDELNFKGLVHLFMLQGSKGAKEHFWSTILEQKMYEVQRSKGAKEQRSKGRLKLLLCKGSIGAKEQRSKGAKEHCGAQDDLG